MTTLFLPVPALAHRMNVHIIRSGAQDWAACMIRWSLLDKGWQSAQDIRYVSMSLLHLRQVSQGIRFRAAAHHKSIGPTTLVSKSRNSGLSRSGAQ